VNAIRPTTLKPRSLQDSPPTGGWATCIPKTSQLPRLLLRPQEAALILSVGRTQIYALMNSSTRGGPEIGYVMVGHDRRIPMDQLVAYVARLERRYVPEYLLDGTPPEKAA
jgi:hypothetical protein